MDAAFKDVPAAVGDFARSVGTGEERFDGASV
jgi:hypothetical protein